MNIQQQQQRLETLHRYLMYNKFPYHSVSVVHRHQDLGFHVIFMDSVKYMVTDKIKGYLKANEFTYSYIA
jgi:hypothetical protein